MRLTSASIPTSIPTFLLWNPSHAVEKIDLVKYFQERLSREQIRYLPTDITLFIDPEVKASSVEQLCEEMSAFFPKAIEVRQQRAQCFVDLKLLSSDSMQSFLFDQRSVQPWVLYYSKNGGLGIREGPKITGDYSESTGDYSESVANSSPVGIIPCASMPNHGVAWKKDKGKEGQIHAVLATARKQNQPWDMDSDIGHESGHAAHAPVPLFVHNISCVQLDDLKNDLKTCSPRTTSSLGSSIPDSGQSPISNPSVAHLARFAYFCTEIANVAIIAEERREKENETGLPIARAAELTAFYQLGHHLLPDAGFCQAEQVYRQSGGARVQIYGDSLFPMALPAMRVVPHLSGFVHNFDVPTKEDFARINEAIK